MINTNRSVQTEKMLNAKGREKILKSMRDKHLSLIFPIRVTPDFLQKTMESDISVLVD